MATLATITFSCVFATTVQPTIPPDGCRIKAEIPALSKITKPGTERDNSEDNPYKKRPWELEYEELLERQ